MGKFLDGAQVASETEITATLEAAREVPQAPRELSMAPPVTTAAEKIAPGTERWPVKTGTDQDVGQVKNTLVPSTVRELGSLPRPGVLMPATALNDSYNAKRVSPVETTVWQVKAKVIALKLEADGDYHLVLEDDSGAEMVAEVPYPDNEFIATNSPFFTDVQDSRSAVNKQFGEILAQVNFVPSGTDAKFIPESSASLEAAQGPKTKIALVSDSTDAFKDSDLFSARIDAADATITGVGFFDRAHGQTGAAPNIIELHPVLDISFTEQGPTEPKADN